MGEQEHCPTRDVLQVRLDKLRIDLESDLNNNVNIIYPLIAVIGEIGNNAFDHNLGKWRDVMGIYFDVDFESKIVVIADRGQGILSSIKAVKPETETDLDALKVAFTKTISGRYPEKRGNWLKFVTKVARDLGFEIELYTGNAKATVKDKELQFNFTQIGWVKLKAKLSG